MKTNNFVLVLTVIKSAKVKIVKLTLYTIDHSLNSESPKLSLGTTLPEDKNFSPPPLEKGCAKEGRQPSVPLFSC